MNKDIKTILRKQILSARKILPEETWARRNELICQNVIKFIAKGGYKTVHSFLPIERNKEVNTWLIIKNLLKRGERVVISITDFEKEQMSHFYYEEGIKFRLNKMKIPEPVNAMTASIQEVELVLIPLLAADKSGNRIGYGKGYYDRLLNPIKDNVVKVGLNLGTLFDAFSLSEQHDVKLDYCITPFEIIECKP